MNNYNKRCFKVTLLVVVLLLGYASKGCCKSVEEYLSEGEYCEIMGNYDEAIPNYEKAIEADPLCAKAYYKLGVIYNKKKEYKKSRDNLYLARQNGFNVESELYVEVNNKAEGRAATSTLRRLEDTFNNAATKTTVRDSKVNNVATTITEQIGGREYVLPSTFTAICPFCRQENRIAISDVKLVSNIKCDNCNKLYKYKPLEKNVYEYWKAVKESQKEIEKAEAKALKEMERERRRRARGLGIGKRLLTLCTRCGSIVYLEQLEALDIYEGIKSRQIVCGRCGNLYDIADGIDYYNEYARRVNVQRAAIAMQAMSNAISQGIAQRQQYEAAQRQQTMNLVSHNNYSSSMPITNTHSYTANSIGNFDYVRGTGGYSGSGQQIGNFYYYNDNQGGRYTTQRIGNFDYVSGSDGYSGSGQQIGDSYYYRDNK